MGWTSGRDGDIGGYTMSERNQLAARQRGELRSANIRKVVIKALDDIEAEMRANEGIYPLNGGALSKSEISRRAGISDTTLYSPKQKELNEKVGRWLESLKEKKVVGRTNIRKSQLERAADWKEKHDALQNMHIVTELEIQSLRAELDVVVQERDQALEAITLLRAENSALREQILRAGLSFVELANR